MGARNPAEERREGNHILSSFSGLKWGSNTHAYLRIQVPCSIFGFKRGQHFKDITSTVKDIKEQKKETETTRGKANKLSAAQAAEPKGATATRYEVGSRENEMKTAYARR